MAVTVELRFTIWSVKCINGVVLSEIILHHERMRYRNIEHLSLFDTINKETNALVQPASCRPSFLGSQNIAFELDKMIWKSVKNASEVCFVDNKINNHDKAADTAIKHECPKLLLFPLFMV